MRIAIVASRIPDRAELVSGPIDTEWLVQIAADHDLTVLVDHETAGSQRLRDVGAELLVSPKRESRLPDGTELSADAVQARNLARLHSESPFEAVIYDTSISTDYAWFELGLREIPRGVALGGGLTADLGVVLDDPALFQYFGRAAWSGTGNLAGADFLLSDVPATAFGYRADHLPPVRGTGMSVSVQEDGPESPPGLVVVVATAERPAGLATLIDRVEAVVPVDEGTTIAVIHRDLRFGADTAREVIAAGCPEAREQSLLLMTPDQDGVAAAMLDSADLVVAAAPADLAIRAVAAAGQRTGLLLLEGDVATPEPLTEAPPIADAPRVVLLPVPGSPADVADILDSFESGDEADIVVLHTPDLAEEARRLLGLRGLRGADLGVLAMPDPIYGSPLPDTPCPQLLAVGRTAWPSIRRRLTEVESIGELVVWCLGLGLAEHVRLLVVPGADASCIDLPVENVLGLPPWLSSTGVLARPNLSGINTLDISAPVAQATEGLKEWVESHSWKERAQLALPWKWGLLDKAMKDTW